MLFYHERSEERAIKKLVDLTNSCAWERLEEKKMLDKQLKKLQTLLRDKSIGRSAYERFRRKLEICFGEQLDKRW